VVLVSVIWFLSWCVVRPALSGSRPVDLVHEPSVGLAGGGELVVAFFEFPAEAEDGLALGVQLGLDCGGSDLCLV